jgi:hypothetical protein
MGDEKNDGVHPEPRLLGRSTRTAPDTTASSEPFRIVPVHRWDCCPAKPSTRAGRWTAEQSTRRGVSSERGIAITSAMTTRSARNNPLKRTTRGGTVLLLTRSVRRVSYAPAAEWEGEYNDDHANRIPMARRIHRALRFGQAFFDSAIPIACAAHVLDPLALVVARLFGGQI